MSSPAWLVGRDGRVIWDGDSNALLPDPGTLVREIRSDEGVPDLSLLRRCVVLVLRHATPASLPTWCSWLCCLGDPGPTLRSLRDSSGGSRVCGYVFKRGDIAWNCRRCQVDSTCVQCDACFRRSDHTGHPVYFHRTAPGGCCDCGDEEAWAEAGCCDRHRAPSGDKGAVDPLASLPPDFEAVARLVVRGVVLFLGDVAWSSLDTFDPASLESAAAPDQGGRTPGGGEHGGAAGAGFGGLGGAGGAFFASGSQRGSLGGPYRRRAQGQGARGGEGQVMVRVHNDDVHTFDQVIDTFRRLGHSPQRAQELTQQVDEKGIASVHRTTRAKALPMFRFLCSHGLMASVCDGAHVELESRGLALLTWLGSLCSQTDGLRRVVAQELVAATRLPTPANASPLSETPLGSSAEEHSTSSRTGAGNGKRGSNWEFNSSLWRRSDVFGLSAERGYLRVNRIRGDGDGIPAEAAAPYWAAREAPLGVLIGADPMLARPLRMALHGLLMRLLVDQEFKRDFALAFARLYEFLNALYCRGIGVSDESIFGFSVQTFTTPSLVRLLADVSATTSSALLPNPENEALPRVWGFTETPGLLAMLMKALVRTMRSAGCRGCGRHNNSSDRSDENAFLDHDITVHRRFSHVFRDLEYALQSPGTALDVATQATNPGPGSEPLKLWFKVLSDLQYMDTNVRQRGSHIEYESRRFIGAFGLSFSLASVTEALVDRALRKAPPPPTSPSPISASAASQRKPAAATSALNLAGDDISDSSAQRSAGCEATPEGSWNAGGVAGAGIGPGVGVGGRGEWAEESRRIEAGEVFSWRAVAALKAWVDARTRKGSSVYRVVSAPTPLYGLNPTLGKRVDFRVQTQAVSLHLPLHRFFGKVVQTLSQEGMAIPRVPVDVLLPLVEFPMRALVFHAQVMARLWVRNGATAHNQATSYATPPMCRHMRDLDMIALQVGCLYMGIDYFLELLLNKFDLDEWFLDPVDKAGPQDSATGAAASDSCLPPPPQQYRNLNADAFAGARPGPLPGAAAPSATPPGLVPPQASPRTAATAYAANVAYASEDARVSRIRKISPEVRLLLAEDYLTLLIALLTELPRPGGRASARGALRREVVHRLASSECTHSEVAAVVSNLAEPASEDFLDEVLREVGEARDSSASARSAAAVAATAATDGGAGPGAAVGDGTGIGSGGRESGRRGRGGGATKYGLAPSAVGEYDPTFVRLSRTEHQQAAVETIARKRKSRSSSSCTPLPLVGTPPPAHAKFLPVRQGLLYSPVIVRAVRSVLRNYASKVAGKTSDLLLSRALHVLTLQLHGLDRPQQQPYQQPGKGSCSSGSIEAPVNAGGVEETKGGGGIRGGCPLVSGFSQSAYFAAVLEESSKASDSGKAGAELRGRGRGLLGELGGGDVGGGGSLCEVLGKVAVDHGALGALFEDGLQWIVREFARRNPLCREVLGRLGALPEAERVASLEGRDAGGGGSMKGRGSSGEHASPASTSSPAAAGVGGGRSAGTTLAEKKKRAQAMAMEAMRKRQAAFAKHIGLGSLEDDTDEDSVAAADTKGGATSSKAGGSPSEVSLEEGSPECIMCHERSGWAMGYVGLAQRSSVLSTGVAVNPHRGLLRRQMLVVGKHGCQLRRGIDVKSEKVQVLRPGRRCEVLVGEQVGRRVRCIAPAVGWASMRDSDGDTILAPLETKAFERWGRQRLHIGLCGHAVHFACWDTYFASLVERSISRQTFDGRMSVDVNRSEFFCPLCKNLSNTLIAHIPQGAHASNLFPPAPGVGTTVIAGGADDPSDGAPNSREQQQQQQHRQEEDVVERLSTADGLAEWVLLEEDGGLGVAGAMGREGGGGEQDDMEVDVDVDVNTAEVEAREGFVLVGGDVGMGKRRGKGRKERLPLQFGVPRSGLGGALTAGVSTRKMPRDVKQEEQSRGSSGDGGRPAAYAKVIGAMSLRRLADSLCQVSHPPWNSPSEIQGSAGIRMLHQLWAAAGYTAAATEATSRAEWTAGEREGGTGAGEGVGGTGPGPGGEVLRANETLHLRRLLRVVEHGVALLDNGGRDASAAAANRGGPTSSSTGATQPRATASAALEAATAALASAGGMGAGGRGGAFPTATAALLMGDDLSSASESSGDGGWMEGGGGLGGSDDSGALGVLAAAAAAAAAADQAVPLPAGGMVAAIKLARVIGGAAVVPPREGIKKPPVAGGGGGGGRQKQGIQWILRREEAWWIRRGVEMPMQVIDGSTGDERESIKIASQLISFKKKQREALRRAVAVARTYFFSERHRERVANSRAAAVPLPPEAASLLETVWEADTAWPLMQTPLLAWDLTTLLVGGVSMAPSWSGRAGVVRAACVARLCQAILQPEVCLRGPGGAAAAAAAMTARGSTTSGAGGGGRIEGGEMGGRTVPSVAAALEALRNALAEATETAVSPMAPVGEDLIAICYASWLPFLRCAALVIAAASSSHNSTDANESGGCSRTAGWSGEAASAEGGEEAWRQRVVAAYNSSGRLFRGGGGGDGKPTGGLEDTSATTVNSNTATSASAAYSQGVDVGGGRAGGGAGGCVAAVEELCAALGVPLPQDLAISWSALTMVRCWGKQFAGAFGPAQKRAGMCDIGGEALSLSAVEACLRESPKRGLPAEADAYGSGDGAGAGGTSSGVAGDFQSDEGDDDAAAATADGIEALSGSGGSAEGSGGVGVGGGGGGGVLLGMPMDAEVAADNGAGAAEAMGFDVLEIGGRDWMELGIGGAGAWAGGVGGRGLMLQDLDPEDALQNADDVGADDEDDPEDAHQESANAGPAAAATGEWQAIGTPNPPLPPPPPPMVAPQGFTAPASVPPATAQHQSNQAATSGSVSPWANRDRGNFRFPFPKVLVPYLGNLTGGYTTPDETGVPLKSVLFDVSHLGLSCQDNLELVELPESYTELYGRAQSPHASAAAAAAAAEGGVGHDTDPAVCLVCGQVVAAGSKPNDGSPGECTIHARYCGSGIGIFFLVQRYHCVCVFIKLHITTQSDPVTLVILCHSHGCVVLLIRDSRGAYYPSIYLDDHGEEDAGLKRGRPLFLNRHRYNALKQVYLRHRVAQEVSAIRASSDRVIREDYY
ncbi:unnamed protein product [Ascophyllum nodosum]